MIKKIMTTINQKKVISKTLENLRAGKIVKKGKILRESGYSDATVTVPSTIYDSKGVREGLKDYLNELDLKRKMALTHINEKKLEKSPARDCAYVNDLLTKNHQLLGGGATERLQITEKDKEEIDKLFEQNADL